MSDQIYIKEKICEKYEEKAYTENIKNLTNFEKTQKIKLTETN